MLKFIIKVLNIFYTKVFIEINLPIFLPPYFSMR